MSRYHCVLRSNLFFWFFILIFSNVTFSDDPMKIGESLDNEATGFNNSRKIVRTSSDRRIVVFQNRVDNRQVIQWCYSDDGINWSTVP